MSTASMSSATGARYKVIIMLISQWYVSTAATQLHHVSQVIHKVQSVQTGQQYKYIPMRVANLLCRSQLVSQCVYSSSALFCLLSKVKFVLCAISVSHGSQPLSVNVPYGHGNNTVGNMSDAVASW